MTRNTQAATILLAALLTVSCIMVGVVAGDGGALVDLDENTPLTQESAYTTFETTGVVTADVGRPDLSITLAKEHDDVDLEGFHNDYAYEYLRVTYREEIDREIRFYVPSAYWGPYYDQAVEPVAGDDVTATFTPVGAGHYTAVTIAFDGKTSAVFKVSQLKGSTWSFWSRQDAKLGNATGFETGIAGEDQWNYASDSDWSSDGTLLIENVSDAGRVSIQYDADVSPSTEVWLKVPQGEDSSTPVYWFKREAASNESSTTLVVVSKQVDPPAVRVKKSATARDGLSSIINDWQQIPDRVGHLLDRLFGSGRK